MGQLPAAPPQPPGAQSAHRPARGGRPGAGTEWGRLRAVTPGPGEGHGRGGGVAQARKQRLGKNKCYKKGNFPSLPRKGPPSSLWQAGQPAKAARPHTSGPFQDTPQPQPRVLVPPPSSSLPRGRGLGLSTPRAAWDRAWPPVIKLSDSDGLGSMSWGGGGREPISCQIGRAHV